jgi:hypothetical protein
MTPIEPALPIKPTLPIESTLQTPTEQFYSIAKQAKQIGDPHPRVAAAQWALESGWGKHVSGKNNYWGLKAHPSDKNTKTLHATQTFDGKEFKATKAYFLDFDSVADGLQARLERLKASRYAHYWTVATPQEAAQVLQEAKYASDPAYAQKLTQIIAKMYGSASSQVYGRQMIAAATTSTTTPTSITTPVLRLAPEAEEMASLAWPEGLRPSLTSPRTISGRTTFDGKGVTAKTQNGRWWVDVRGRIFHANPSSEEACEAYLPWNTAEKNILGLEPEETGQGVKVIGKLGTLTIIPDHPTRFGYEGYIRVLLGEETETLPEGPLFSRIAAEMVTWLGTPYKYGGTTKSGCDCSGFVGSLYRTIGVSVPRTSGDLANIPSTVSNISELHFGDLLCYPGHVAVYLGNGQTIEALGTPEKGGKVQKHHIWNRDNVTVKRLLP